MFEANIDCLSGPTHHFGGLSFGNIASTDSKGELSRPKKAALQGLEKMKLLYDLGIPQIILPPHPRPLYSALRAIGFRGSDQEVIERAFHTKPEHLLEVSSSSAMWMANGATVTPSSDALDKKLHLTPANLASNFHRAIEVETTARFLNKLFSAFATIHPALPSCTQFLDEGAANHTRFSTGLNLFVYGSERGTKKYPARQSRKASEAIARLHQLPASQCIFLEQNPAAIDAGCFHNDVISTGFETLFLYHEKAFVDFQPLPGITCVKILETDLSLEEAVKSYFFNSQIVRSHNKLILICPEECRNLAFIRALPYFDEVLFIDLNESMKNGGGPACLRLRVQLTAEELQAIPQSALFSPTLYKNIKSIIETSYPDSFHLTDLLDPQFRAAAQHAITQIDRLIFQ